MLRGRKSGRVHPYIFEDLRLEDSGEDKDSSNEVEVEIDEESSNIIFNAVLAMKKSFISSLSVMTMK